MKVIETQYKGIDIGDIYGLMNRKRNFKTAKYLEKKISNIFKISWIQQTFQIMLDL